MSEANRARINHTAKIKGRTWVFASIRRERRDVRQSKMMVDFDSFRLLGQPLDLRRT